MEYSYPENTQPNRPMFDDEDASSFNLMEWVIRFLRNWYLFVAGVIIALGIAYFQNRSWVPQYVTETKIVIEDNSANQYNFMQGFGVNNSYRNSNNQLLLLGSYDLIRQTLNKLPLGVDYYTRGRFKTNSLYGREPIDIELAYLDERAYGYEFECHIIDEASFTLTADRESDKPIVIKGKFGVPFEHSLLFATVHKRNLVDGGKFLLRFRTIESLESEFAGRLSLSYVGEMSSVISSTLVGDNIARDQDFLNALADEFLANNLGKKNAEAIRTIEFIDEQLGLIATSLSESEGRLREFRRDNNIIDVNSYMSSVLSKLVALDEQRMVLDQKERYFRYLSKYLRDNITEDVLVAPSSIGVSDPTLLDLVGQYNELQLQRTDLGPKNPNYERYTRQMDKVRNMLLEVLRNVRSVYDLDRTSFNEQYEKVLAESRQLPEKENAMINMERDYKINDNYYTFLLQKRSEAQIRKASNSPDNSILQKARVISLVNGDKKSKTYMMFAIIGLLIPAAFVVLRELLNVTIRTEKDIEKLTKFTIIGGVRHTNSDKAILSTLAPKSAFTESLRVIRTRIEFVAQRKAPVCIMVTSAESGDGKTYFAANFAGVYSLISKKTLLIDLDFRKPSVAALLHKHNKGLVNHLVGDITLDEAIIKDETIGFDVLLSGVIPPNPGELIRSEKLKNIITELKTRYDYIVIDTSPLGLVADAYSLSRLVDITLIVVRSGKTNKTFFKRFVAQVKADKIPNVYLILNDIDEKQMGSYGYGYGYGNNSSYYVQTDFEENKTK
ncbi:MAG TPA: polysaccharide biosynthesis tyrosine autokinase [Paludibacteraceae bacterium]|nr:polysaccharide biosynthesis tyrosine autokinase [Paludibacteraceae bacterium]HQB68558.1 polysaccharide biosynthesis tyrosine autokinase [Paludibacteraceae bacterium]HRS67059.1 polysaccharide biosynthesis tyrosine autokinase [Paludibacteraceae bacterium]